MIRRPPRSTLSSSSAASDVYKRQVLGQVTPRDHIEEGGRFLPLVGLPVLPAAIDRDTQRGGGLPVAGVADLRIAGQIPHDGGSGCRAHGGSLSLVHRGASPTAPSTRQGRSHPARVTTPQWKAHLARADSPSWPDTLLAAAATTIPP